MTAYQPKMEEKAKQSQHVVISEMLCHQEVTVMTKEMEYCPFCGLFFAKV